MRAFGTAADLDLDFASADRPGLVTALLERCGTQGDGYWWAQQVGCRTAALLRLAALTDRCTSMALAASCAEPDCGEAFEFELPLPALVDRASSDEPMLVRLDAGRIAALRRPTGDDLRRWRDAAPASRDEAVRTMLSALVVRGEAGLDDAPRIAEAIAGMDPLIAFSVSCRCPACGAPAEVGVDLEALALKRLAARQQALLLEIHRLASAYGWTEAEVLAVPPMRRARYLELLDCR